MIERPQAEVEPAKIEWLDNGSRVGITWRDGHESAFALTYLRRICPCANCRGSHEAPPLAQPPKKRFNILSEAQAKAATGPATLLNVAPVGRYAMAFTWADGHAEGIYSFRYLRDMCPCPECGARAAAEDDAGG